VKISTNQDLNILCKSVQI